MTLSAMEDLTAQVFKCLSGDPALTSVLGAGRVFDRLPDKTKPPYIVIGETSEADWSTATESGSAFAFSVFAWSRKGDRAEAHQIAKLIGNAFEAAPPALDDHHLVNFRRTLLEVRRDVVAGTVQAALRFRAVTEPKN